MFPELNVREIQVSGDIDGPGLINALTVDVEDYYMVSAFSDTVSFEDWHLFDNRALKSTQVILDLLDIHNVRGTFFILGWIAERYPSLVRDIHARGHEVASHGYNHRLVYELSPEDFRKDIRRTKGLLEDLTGKPIRGFRAASYSIVRQSLWALEILIQEGYEYDSSIIPVRHDRYGLPGASRFPYRVDGKCGSIIEFPPSTYQLARISLPVAGGGYLRLFPLWFTKRAIRYINNTEGKPALVYVHPWEIDVGQPRLMGKVLSRFRHYVNLHTTRPKLEALLREFEFGRLDYLLPYGE